MSLPLASVQLYSLAAPLKADMSGSLDRLAALGLRHVEAFDFVDKAPALRSALDSSGLTSPTGHAPLLSDELWTPRGSIPTPAPEVVFEAAATVGITTVFDPFVAADRWADRDGVERIAARLNEVAAIGAGFGIEVGYHNHAQEFVAEFDGKSAYEYAIERLDDSVRIELDLFWATAGGQDVVDLATRLGDRLRAVHVKDGLAPATNPWAPGEGGPDLAELDQRRAGEGEIALTAAMRTNAAIEYAVIEYDTAPGEVFADIGASLAWLKDNDLVAATEGARQ